MRNALTFLAFVAAIILVLALCVIMSVGPAKSASHSRAYVDVAQTGISIAPLLHGQMAVMSAHRKQVLATAEQALPTHPTATQLRQYVLNQTRACLWGAVPFSLDSESSPFHRCTHASLAGTMALFQHLQAHAATHPAVQSLTATLNQAMLANGTASLCAYSTESFNTEAIIWPTVWNYELRTHQQGIILALLFLPLFLALRGWPICLPKNSVTRRTA